MSLSVVSMGTECRGLVHTSWQSWSTGYGATCRACMRSAGHRTVHDAQHLGTHMCCDVRLAQGGRQC